MAHDIALGDVVAQARKARGLSLRQLADLVTKKDGTTVSPQYLNDIEHGRRMPSEDVLEQLAANLEIERYYLLHLAGTVPSDLRSLKGNSQQIVAAYKAFRRQLGN